MSITFLETIRTPSFQLLALNEDGSTLMDITQYLSSFDLTFTDELISHVANFKLASPNAYFDKYGTKAGASILVEGRLIQFKKGFLDASNSYSQTLYPAFVGRIVDVKINYSPDMEEIITFTCFDLLRFSLKRKFTSDAYYSTQLNLIAEDFVLRYGDKAFQLFGFNLAALDYLQGTFQAPDMTLIDVLQDIYDLPVYQVWANYTGQLESFAKLGSGGHAVLGYPDQLTAPTPDFTFDDSQTVAQINNNWQDVDFINQCQVKGIALTESTVLGPLQLLAQYPAGATAGLFNLLSSGDALPTVNLYYTDQTGNSNQIIAQNCFLKIWDPSFNHEDADLTYAHMYSGPYKYIASGPGVVNDRGDVIPFPVCECLNGFQSTHQQVISYSSGGSIEGHLAVVINQVKNVTNTGFSNLHHGHWQYTATANSPVVEWPTTFVPVTGWANSDGGGFEWFIEVWGQTAQAIQNVLTSISDYNSELLTEDIKDIFEDHETFQCSKSPIAMGTPVEVIVNPSMMAHGVLSTASAIGDSTLSLTSTTDASNFYNPTPTIPSIVVTGTNTPVAQFISIGTGNTKEYAVVNAITGNILNLSGTLGYAHDSGEVVQGLTGVISYDDIYQSLLFKGDWDRGRIVFNNQTFRAFGADSPEVTSALSLYPLTYFKVDPAGHTYTGTVNQYSTPIDLTKTVNPAPIKVYQTNRTGADYNSSIGQGFTYHFLGLTVGRGYLVRLHYCEPVFAFGSGSRTFDVLINGAVVDKNFDIWSNAGGGNIAFVKEYTGVNCNISGELTIQFANGPSFDGGSAGPLICGIEVILPQGNPDTIAFAVNCGGTAIGPSPSTTLTSNVSISSNTITVANTTGFTIGGSLQIDDTSFTLTTSTISETNTITNIVGSTITLSNEFQYSHLTGAQVYVLPVVQATYGWSAVQQTYGVQSKSIDDPLLQTLEQCQSRAEYETNKGAWTRNPISIVTASVPIIKPGKCIQWYNPRVSTNGSDFSMYVQTINRHGEITRETIIDVDTYTGYLLYVGER